MLMKLISIPQLLKKTVKESDESSEKKVTEEFKKPSMKYKIQSANYQRWESITASSSSDTITSMQAPKDLASFAARDVVAEQQWLLATLGGGEGREVLELLLLPVELPSE
nr:uncharacterized protein LOC109154307 [Ipomoea batatas]